MVLRKYLSNAKLTSIDQIENDSLFDVDNPEHKDLVESWCKKSGICIKAVVQTFHGYHFLVQPFNPTPLGITDSMIVKLEDGVEFGIKKDANTILYGIS